MAEAPRRNPRENKRGRRGGGRSRSRSRSRDEQPAQSRADRGRFRSRIANPDDRTSWRASIAPMREWLSNGLAYNTLHNELEFVKISEPRTKLSLAGGQFEHLFVHR